ncbi:alpha-amylase family glycosyl hydrolase [Cryomorphaceae bacterium 1068]|nr:alpha-amylase family glycosyl hydrolase [Cryomorphaceae bacterium 1068]
MNKIKCLILLVGAAAFGCASQKDVKPTVENGKAIVGIASPIRLDFGQTEIHLGDYFENPEKVDSVSFGVAVDFDLNEGILTVENFNSDDPVTFLSASYEGVEYEIPVFKSRKQAHVFTYDPPTGNPQEIGLKGNFNGWNYKAGMLSEQNGVWYDTLILNPGLYEYQVVQDGVEMLDPTNPDKKDNGSGGFNSAFRVGATADRPHISTYGYLGDSIVLHFPEELTPPLILWENQVLGDSWYARRGDRLSFPIPDAAAESARSYIRVFASDGEQRSNDVLIPLEKGMPVMEASALNRTDKHTYSMYFMMVDRFVNAQASNDIPVDDPEILPIANYYGGDLAGVNQKIEEGYFQKLGMNTVWLSPIVQNPLGAYGLWDKGGVRTKFSGYHGYWPISSSAVDMRFGNDSVLHSLIDEAHKEDMNVILDYVANHVHQEHPVYQLHPDWATELYLPDGSLNTERWDEYRLTTWFDTFMPTLDLRRDDVTAAMTDSALYWFEEFPIDGFRHDATKHIPLSFWRELTRKLKYRVVVPEDRNIYQIGETYGNPDLIGSYISSGMLDAQFDFNLYDAEVSAFGKDNGSLEDLNRVFGQSLLGYGDHHLMGNISGNQDRTRFISYADGTVDFGEDPKLAGWTRDITRGDTIGFNRLGLLQAFNFFSPGIPVIYYGDEYGMIGAGDPDNRRMMQFGDDLTEREQAMLQEVTTLANLRKGNMALLYGDTEVLSISNKEMAVLRNYFDQTAVLFINSSRQEKTVTVEVPVHYNIEGFKANFGNQFTLDGKTITIALPAVSFEILTL